VTGRARQISLGEVAKVQAPRAPAMPVCDGDLELF
jgi:hypothetical protein